MASSNAVNKVLGPEKIKVGKQKSSLSKQLPFGDSCKVEQASGETSNSSAARYADAVGNVLPGTAVGGKRPMASGR